VSGSWPPAPSAARNSGPCAITFFSSASAAGLPHPRLRAPLPRSWARPLLQPVHPSPKAVSPSPVTAMAYSSRSFQALYSVHWLLEWLRASGVVATRASAARTGFSRGLGPASSTHSEAARIWHLDSHYLGFNLSTPGSQNQTTSTAFSAPQTSSVQLSPCSGLALVWLVAQPTIHVHARDRRTVRTNMEGRFISELCACTSRIFCFCFRVGLGRLWAGCGCFTKCGMQE
jgi:hypothetical protein